MLFSWLYTKRCKNRVEDELALAQSQVDYWVKWRAEAGDYMPEYKEEEVYWRKKVDKLTRQLEKMQ